MPVRALLLLALLSGCGASALTIANHVGLAIQSSAIACDWRQTRRAAETGWAERVPTPQGYGTRSFAEGNPIMGPTPSTSVVDGYFAAALGVTALAWYLTPRRYRVAVAVAVTAVQVAAIAHNFSGDGRDTMGVCGL